LGVTPVSRLPIRCLEFHPSEDILLVGTKANLTVMQASTGDSPKVLASAKRKTRVAHFTDSSEISCTIGASTLSVWDLNSDVSSQLSLVGINCHRSHNFAVSPDRKYLAFFGDTGEVCLVDNKTKLKIKQFLISGVATAACFSMDSKYLYTAGSTGELYLWDIGLRRCIHRCKDEGALKIKAIACSMDAKYLATGQDSGVVNVYELDKNFSSTSNPKPIKSLMNLTVDVSQVKFNHDTQILGFLAQENRTGLRLAHIPSFSVFDNWPAAQHVGVQNTNIMAFDFSAKSHFLAVGTWGYVELFKLSHYCIK